MERCRSKSRITDLEDNKVQGKSSLTIGLLNLMSVNVSYTCQVTHWPKEDYGKFFNGDSYIILNTYKKPGSDVSPDHECIHACIHFAKRPPKRCALAWRLN